MPGPLVDHPSPTARPAKQALPKDNFLSNAIPDKTERAVKKMNGASESGSNPRDIRGYETAAKIPAKTPDNNRLSNDQAIKHNAGGVSIEGSSAATLAAIIQSDVKGLDRIINIG